MINKKFNKYLINIPCLIFSILFVLFFAEMIARMYVSGLENKAGHPECLKKIHQVKETKYLYGLRPNSESVCKHQNGNIFYKINSKGLRDKEIAYKKKEEEKRILILGDSVSFGYKASRDELFSHYLEKKLGKNYTVINSSVGGYNTFNELEYLKAEGIKYNPDVVILGICLNDVDQPFEHFSHHTLEKMGTIPNSAYPSLNIKDWLKSKFVLPRLIYPKLQIVKHKIRRLKDKMFHKETTDGGKNDIKKYKAYEGCLISLAKYNSSEWKWLRKQLLQINAYLEERNIKFGIVVFPLKYQLTDGSYDLANNNFDIFFKDSGINGINVLEMFRVKANDAKEDLFVDTTHLNSVGHEFAADLIKEFLIEKT